jgi:large-conductance mechanosensitive channel
MGGLSEKRGVWPLAILAFVVFLVVKKLMGALKKEEEKPVEKTPNDEILLAEIRDLLKEKA